MIRGVLAFGLALLCCTGARAQQQNNILPLIIQFESGGDPTAQSKTSSASGLFQDVTGTWAEALSLCGGACGTIAQYATAASAPASVQIAANAALINDHGLTDWTCPNCDPGLVAAINQMGGVGAFQTSGLSTDPATYASADTAAGLQTFMTNMTVGTDGQSTSGVGTAVVKTIPTAGPLSRPFQWSWDHIMVPGQQSVAEVSGKVQHIAWLPFAAIVVIWGAVKGTKLWAGQVSWGGITMDLVALGIVGALVTPGFNLYGQWSQFIEGLPAYFASNIGSANAGAGTSAVFDSVWQSFLIKVIEAWSSSPWEKILLTGLILFFVILDILIALGSMFFAFLTANFVIYIFLAVGPVFILGYLFQHTYGFFRWWLDLTVGLLAFILILDVVLNFFSGVLAQLIDANGPGISSGTPWTYWIPNLLGSVIVLNVLTAVIAFVTLQVGRIHGGIRAGTYSLQRSG